MELLDFGKLQRIFEAKETIGVVKIYFCFKTESNIRIHSEDQFQQIVLDSINLLVNVGECYTHEKNIFCHVGNEDDSLVVKQTNILKAMGSVWKCLRKFNKHEIAFSDCDWTEDALYSLIISSYSYTFLKDIKDIEYEYNLISGKHEKIIKIAHAQNLARFLGDTPANLMTPTLFCEYAKKMLVEDNIEVLDFSKDFLIENKMNLILSVSQGSEIQPKLLQVIYKGENKENIDVSVVGKGVTFDSGGISLKPSAEMFKQKSDMMGAATLLCSIKLAASLKLKINILGVFPLVENMPSGKATKPGDVFKSMSGITVEVDNTDAEGRLVLADGLTYAQKFNPKYLFDAATLTGAIRVALGNVFSGYFTENTELSNMIYDSGCKTLDLMWRMPLSPYYRDSLKSEVSDINNMGGRGAGSCKAAEFLKEFVNTNNTIWAHFDIAGTKRDSHMPYLFGSGVTGRPVPVFIDIYEKIANLSIK